MVSHSLHRTELSENRRVLIFLGLVLLIKFYLLFFVLGPIMWPDTGGYEYYADFILEQGHLFAKEKFGLAPIQSTYFRMLGYPAMIAISKICFGSFWSYGLVSLQFLISGIASFYVYKLSRLMKLSKMISFFVCFGYATGTGLIFDFSILTDSFFASFFIMAFFYLISSVFNGERISYKGLCFSGFLLIICLFLRDGALQLSLCFLPWLILAAWTCSDSFFVKLQRLAKLCFCLYVPLLFIFLLLGLWNEALSGYFFLTIGLQTVYFQRPLEMIHDGLLPSVFLYLPNDYQGVAEVVFKKYAFSEIIVFNDLLFKDFGLDAVQIKSVGQELFMRLWINEPGLMLLEMLKKMKFLLFLEQGFRPFAFLKDLSKVTDYFHWASFKDLRLGRLSAGDISISSYFLYGLNLLTQFISLVIGFAFVALPVLTWYAFARGFLTKIDVWSNLCLWLSVWMFYGIYALIHFEIRYIVAIVPLMVIGGIRALQVFRKTQT